jgi:hypothetical protein
MELIAPKVAPVLDPEFRPAALAWREFAHSTEGKSEPVRIAVEQGDGSVYVFQRAIARDTGNAATAVNLRFLEREVKFLLWAVGGFRIHIDAPEPLVALLRDYVYRYSPTALFDMDVMGPIIYGRPFEIRHSHGAAFPKASHVTARAAHGRLSRRHRQRRLGHQSLCGTRWTKDLRRGIQMGPQAAGRPCISLRTHPECAAGRGGDPAACGCNRCQLGRGLRC